MANIIENLVNMFSGNNKNKNQGAEQAPSLQSSLSSLADSWTSWLDKVKDDTKNKIQSGNYSVQASSQASQATGNEQSPMYKLGQKIGGMLANLLPEKNAWETDSPFGDKEVDERFANTVLELDAADPDNKQKGILKDAFDITSKYVDNIFASDDVLQPKNSKTNPFAVAENLWRQALDRKIGEYSAAGKGAEELRALLEEGNFETQAQHKENQEKGIIAAAETLRNEQINPDDKKAAEDRAARYDKLNEIIYTTFRDGSLYGLDPEDQAIYREMYNDPNGRKLLEEYEKSLMAGGDASIAKAQELAAYGRQKASALRNGSGMTFDEADKYLSDRNPMYNVAKEAQGNLGDYNAAYGDLQGIAKKIQKKGVDSLTAAEEQAWQDAISNGPKWLAGWLANEQTGGMGGAALNQYQADELAGFSAGRMRQLQEAGQLYTPYAITPKNEAVWEAYIKTPEGAAMWAEDAQGTKDEKKAKENLWFVERQSKYDEVASRPDFAETSKANEDFHSGDESFDQIYNVINNIGGAAEQAGLLADIGGSSNYAVTLNHFMKPVEKGIFNTYAKSGAIDAAKEYLDHLSYDINERMTQEGTKRMQTMSESGVGGALVGSAVSVPLSLARGVGYLDQLGQNVAQLFTGRPVDRNSQANMIGKLADTAREGVQNQVDWNVNILGQNIDAFDFLYGTVMSGIDSFAAGQIGAALGSIANTAEKAQKLASWTGAAILGGGAAQSTMQDVYDRGGNDGTAMLMGAIAGANETLWERWSIGNLIEHGRDVGKKTFAEELKNVLTEAGVNASEEFNTSVANGLAEYIINHDDREVQKRADEYRRLGLTKEEALAKARGDFWASAVMDAAGGLLMGGAFGGVENVQAAHYTNQVDKTVGKGFSPESIDTMYSLAESENASEKAKNLARKFPKGKANAKQMGELFRELSNTMGAGIKEALHNMGVADIALRLGQETGAVDRAAAEAVTAMMEGQNLSGEQVAAIAANPAALKIVDELFKPEAKGDATGTGAAAGEGVSGAAERISREPVQFEPMPGMEEAEAKRRQAGQATQIQPLPQAQTMDEEAAKRQQAGQATQIQPLPQGQTAGQRAPKTPTKPPIRIKGKEGQYNIEELKQDGTEVRIRTSGGEEISLEDADVDAGEAAVIQAAAGMENQDEAAAMIAAWQNGPRLRHQDAGPAQNRVTSPETQAEAEAEPAGQGAVMSPDKETARADEARQAQDFALGFRAVYEAAQAGKTAEGTQSIYADMLAPEARQAAEEAGRQAYEQAEAQAEERNAQEAQAAGYRTVKNAGADAVGVLFDRVRDGIKQGGERVNAMLQMLDRVGREFGMQYRVVDKLENDANGKYVHGTNIVYLSLDAEEGAITKAASHEGFHFISAFSPEMKKTITDFVLDRLGKVEGYDLEQRIKEVRQLYRDAAGQELEQGEDRYHDGAIEEIVADSMLDVIGTEENMRALMKESKSTAEKIKEWITNTYHKFREILDRLAGYSPETAALKDDVDYLGKISEMWQEGMRQAAEAWRQAQAGYNDSSAALEQNQAVQQYRQEMQGDMTVDDRENSLTAFLTNLFGDTQKEWIQQHMDQWEEGLGKFRQALLDYKRGGVALNVALERAGLSPLSGNDIRVASYAADQAVTLEGAKERANARALADDLEESDGTESYGDHMKFSLRVTDKNELDFLDNQETVKTYKTMQLVDGKLYPPMAAVVAGSMEDHSVLGQWEKATEHPELIKNGNKFTLNKGRGKGSIDAAYNPYMHSSNLMINDQFSGAYNRPDLVTVECEVPVSELNSGYHAEYAKDSVGWHSWHTGTVAGQLRNQKGVERQVLLSRWIKPVRIVSNSEVAQHYAELLEGTEIAVPDNVVPPALLVELEKAGVKIKESGRVQRAAKGDRYSLPNQRRQEANAEYMAAVENGDEETARRLVDEAAENAMAGSKIRDEDGNLLLVYHGTSERFTVFDMNKGRANMDIQGAFFSPWEIDAEGYGENVGRYYLNITNPASEGEGYAALNRFKGQNEAGKKAREYLIAKGYDGVNNGDEEYIAFYPEQIKSADEITYDNKGNVIPLSKRFNEKKQDFRYSLPTQQRQEATPIAKDDRGNDLVVELQGGTVASADVKYSFSSLTPKEKQRIVDALTKKNFEQAAIEKWMNDLQTIAAIIGADRARLDFVADPGKRMLKKNAEYIKTLDASTLCAKRLLYQGTFDAIQHRLPNTPLLPTDLIDFANMMREMGYETPCGICYVESRRRHLGEFVEKWLEEYQGAYKPTVDQVTTSDGLEELRKTHPQAYQDFISAMNKKGVMNPKIVQLRTDYRGDIRRMGKRQVQKVKDIGGLRIQSFSDFETPHLLDMVQAVMDMAAKELTAQAYTKVPNFAWVFGDTGIKINLSLIGKGEGVDANGNLLFDDKEGMPFDEAMKIRNRYSKNVGTILVGINDRHILAAMADDRIDFIIPFHKSGWSQEELNRMPVLNGYSDYTNSQNERRIIGKDENGNYITESLEKTKRQNFQPVGENGYWEFEKSGKENAEKYLRMCAEDGRMPKFAQFLHDNGDGSWSLQADGSTDGYWKTLIDFKMYDNEGVGSPQTKVLPNINMKEAERVLNEYTLDRNGIQRKSNNDLPVARPVVERFVAEYKARNPRESYSLPSRQRQQADAAEAVRQDAELYAQMRQDADSRAALELLTRMHQQTTQGGENALIKPGAFEKRLGEMVEKIKADTATRMSDRAIRKGLRTIYQAMEKPGYSVGEILTYAREFYQQVLEQAPGALVEMDDSTREAVRVLRENPFQLTPDQKSEIKGTYGSLGDFMRKNFGKLKIRNGAKVTLADVWRESLNPLNPGLFAEDTAEADMPGIIDAFLENAHEKKFSGEFGANIGAMSTDGALNLMLDFYDVPGAYKQKSEIRAEYQERFDQARALVNQYRVEARQAMNTARAEYQQKYRERIEKDRQTKAEREAKQGVINEIKRNVKPLKTMLVKGTDNRHIPEAMRGAMERMLNNLGVDRAIFSGQEARELYMKLGKWAADSQLHDAAEAAAYDPDILAKLEWLEEHAGRAKALRDMTMAELEAVRDAVQNMYKMVTEENEIEVNGRKRKVSDLAENVMGQMKEKKDASSNPVLAFLRKVGFKEMTPVYYAKQVGGTLGDLINDMIRSESDVAFIIKDAAAAFDKAAEKYHMNEWIHDKNHLRFQTSAGDTIELTREQAMTLYAWAEREKRNKTQSAAHLRRGGFTYDRNDKNVKKMKGVNFTKSHVLSDADVARIKNYLTDEQRGFVETMVKYLSENMAEKGNEASMRMFGWKKFGEKWYFPYPTDRNFRGKNSTDAKGQPDKQIKYMGSSHALTENAMNPLKLDSFTYIWAKHVDEMARYSVMAEKLDNLQRVTNYVVGGLETETGEVFAPESVKKEIERALGQEGAHYLEQLIRDANGGVMGDERGLSDKFISLFKKGSVAANMSVILQQPSAFVRAMSMVNPRYFGRGLHEHGGFKATRERMYANSGVANLKQWGGFDTNTGGSFANTLLDSVEKDGKLEKTKAIIDEWTGKGAEKADEITWVYMYSAIEAEIDDRTDYKRGTEDFNKAVARRFDEVMRATQVYDSSMAKSEWMRSTSTMDKIVTSFMAEPTLWINMMMDAALDVKNNAPGARGKAARAVGVFVAGTFVNSLLQSIATALRRKKDEGTTIVEKYLAEFASNFTDSLSIEGIAGMIPIARDIVSLFQGYDVERADMAVIGNMIDAWRKMEQHMKKGEMPDVDEWMNLAGMAGNLFGVPVRNIYRDVSGIIMNTFGGASSPIGETSGRDILYSVLEDTSWNSFVKLWDPSNAAYYDRMEQALIKGDMDKYNELRGYMEDTKKVKGDTITTGIKNELKESVRRGLVTEEKAVELMVGLLGVKDEKTAFDQIDKYVAKAKANGDEDFEYSKYAGLMDAVKGGGNVEAEIKRLEERGNARKTVVSNIKSQVKDWYLAGDMTKAQAEKALKTYVGISDSDNNALYWTLDEWDWLKKNPNGTYKSYGNIFDAVDSGNAQKIKAAVQKHLDHPHTKQMATDVHRQITDHFKPIYVELWNKGRKTEAANLKAAILTAYEAAGYARTMKNKDIDKWVK